MLPVIVLHHIHWITDVLPVIVLYHIHWITDVLPVIVLYLICFVAGNPGGMASSNLILLLTVSHFASTQEASVAATLTAPPNAARAASWATVALRRVAVTR